MTVFLGLEVHFLWRTSLQSAMRWLFWGWLELGNSWGCLGTPVTPCYILLQCTPFASFQWHVDTFKMHWLSTISEKAWIPMSPPFCLTGASCRVWKSWAEQMVSSIAAGLVASVFFQNCFEPWVAILLANRRFPWNWFWIHAWRYAARSLACQALCFSYVFAWINGTTSSEGSAKRAQHGSSCTAITLRLEGIAFMMLHMVSYMVLYMFIWF